VDELSEEVVVDSVVAESLLEEPSVLDSSVVSEELSVVDSGSVLLAALVEEPFDVVDSPAELELAEPLDSSELLPESEVDDATCDELLSAFLSELRSVVLDQAGVPTRSIDET